MDNMMINNKMMGEMMQQDSLTQDNTADQMLNVLKQEIAMEESNNLNIYVPQQQKQQINVNNQQNVNNNQTVNNQPQQQQQQAYHDPFLDELKDL